MEVVKGFCGILSSNLTQNDLTARMGVYEICNIIDLVINNDPEVILFVVLR